MVDSSVVEDSEVDAPEVIDPEVDSSEVVEGSSVLVLSRVHKTPLRY